MSLIFRAPSGFTKRTDSFFVFLWLQQAVAEVFWAILTKSKSRQMMAVHGFVPCIPCASQAAAPCAAAGSPTPPAASASGSGLARHASSAPGWTQSPAWAGWRGTSSLATRMSLGMLLEQKGTLYPLPHYSKPPLTPTRISRKAG